MGNQSEKKTERQAFVVGEDFWENGDAYKEANKVISRNSCAEYYTRYSKHQLLDKPVDISIEINGKLSGWDVHLSWALGHIEKFVPGIHFILQNQPSIYVIVVYADTEEGCYTYGNLIKKQKATIHFQSPSQSWHKDAEICRSTALHEILHALGFQHEHQRPDRDKYVDIKKNGSNYSILNDSTPISPFDPFSIMLYDGLEKVKLDSNNDPIYYLMGSSHLFSRRTHLSPLDRVCLNYIWKPGSRNDFSPRKGTTGLYYCGREVTKDHNYPAESKISLCGPNNGPNCDACRVLENHLIPKENSKGRKVWQGSSGYFYCGEYFEKKDINHDGYCGPNNGPPCPACEQLV